ncbi:MAG: DoxX family protein [Ilumatobacteraceae bacterium]|nr:DoxX family protein [Ilumatobacteraceae bacterium]
MTQALMDKVDRDVDGTRIKGMWAWTVLRLLLGWSFLWAFLDKFFGLGFSTCRAEESAAIDFMCDAAMINGGSPTYGFLNFATQASHTGWMFDWMAPSAPDSINLADVGFMLALLLGGVALMLGIGTRIAAIGGAIMMLFMFLAADVWPENNPINSSHVIEMVAFLGIATVGPGAFSLQARMERALPSLTWLR